MPSRYSSDDSVTDADALAANLGIRTLHRADRARARGVRRDARAELFEGTDAGLAEENLQARIRGNVADDDLEQVRLDGAHHRQQERDGHRLRDALRRHGRRLRGDQGRPEDARLRARAATCNERAGRERDPARRCSRSRRRAELRPDQHDTDSLPAVRRARPDHRGLRRGRRVGRRARRRGVTTPTLVRRVARMVDRNEYKRRQAPPGVRVSPKAFGKDRRLPITNRWPG